ncbi:arylesterase [Halorhodospira halochloris]|uniref:arylesterase n=1 Tax=Halorhodospira halochloris TaxID=1052 RepID=UPI001EE93A08|nr:arylesterase [Halorhodospira halochloris]MCG5548173.1 arylesterase [Halorhodospira halochloris]
MWLWQFAKRYFQRLSEASVEGYRLGRSLKASLISLLVILSLSAPLSLTADDDVILVFGDSLSTAYGFERDKAWPALLDQQLAEHGLDYRVVNTSRSGETTGGGLRRLPDTLEEHEPAITLIQLGGNDGLRGQPPQRIKSNLREMITLAEQADSEVVLIGIRIPPNYGRAYAERFEQIYPALAEEHDIELIPFLLEGIWDKEGMMQDDGIHPSAAAQPKILELVWDMLEDSVK